MMTRTLSSHSKHRSTGEKKKRNPNNLSDHMITLHNRLYQALNLGIKCDDKNGRVWKCADIETQRLAVRSISTFLASISPDASKHPLVKNSIVDMLVALEGITDSKNEEVLCAVANVAVKLVDIMGRSITSYHVSKLVDSFSCLLSFPQSSVAASYAITVDHILSKLTPSRKSQDDIWEILTARKAVDCIICTLEGYVSGSKEYEYFKEMASLLKTILWHWPPSRYPVWSNAKLMEGLETLCTKPNCSIEVVLQLYSAIALCGNGAKKLLQHGEPLLSTILQCMDCSQPHSLRVEAFKLAQFLVRSEHGCSTIMILGCESIVQAIIDAMDGWSSCSGRVSAEHVSLVLAACRLALITRWGGDHHTYFWKLGVDRVLVGLLLGNCDRTAPPLIPSSLEELMVVARKRLDANFLPVLWPYIWSILSWLATHCREDMNPVTHGNKHYLDVLIACGCLTMMDSIKGRQISQNDVSDAVKLEPACKAVLLMIHSPCKYIASQARKFLSELAMPNVQVFLEDFLDTLNLAGTRFNLCVVVNLQTVINLMALTCFSVLPKYRDLIFKNDGIKTLTTFIGLCLSNDATIAPHLHYTSEGKTCCYLDVEDWHGGDSILIFSLWCLAELIQHSHSMENHREVISSQVEADMLWGGSDAQILVDRLQNLDGNTSNSPGLRWYAAYILRSLGLYGFPSRLGKRLGKALHEKDLADVQLQLSSGHSLKVHGIILMVICPSIFPSGEYSSTAKVGNGSAAPRDIQRLGRNFQREIRLSSRVDSQALVKLLDFVYTGTVELHGGLFKQLKMLAKGFCIPSLSHMLGRKYPKWGSTVPDCDISHALGPFGHHFSDVILEAKADEIGGWTCNRCALSVPHMHAHKIMLWISCDYMKALFQSGMQDSHAQSIKVPISWEALCKMVSWFYSDKLPKPSSGCIWDNMNAQQQFQEVYPYVELCWLAQFWFLEEMREDALKVVLSCLNSSKNLGLKIIQIAADFSQWEIVELAANRMAPLYPHLLRSGDLESVNEDLVDMVRVVYVRLSQERDC